MDVFTGVFNGVAMALRATKGEEDDWSSAPNRDREGAEVFNTTPVIS
ncbi:MAG TPA: hypothetical protein VN579_06080 [Bryobacteraceae bacterium]|nr:hypothetical protein [Bryobacteraceae bacterium]